MKLAFSTLGCPDWPFDRVLEQAQAMGYQGIEIRGIQGEMRADRIPQFSAEQAEDTMRRLRVAGIEIADFASSVRFDDTVDRDAMLEEGRACVDTCACMGIPFIRIFGNNIPDDASEQRLIRQVGDGVRELCAYAAQKNIGILLEVHGDFNTLPRLLGVVDRAASENFGILWDIAHSDHAYRERFAEFYRPIRHLVKHVHIKDHLHTSDGVKLSLVGDGDIPIAAIVRMLEEDGYNGFYSLEWEKKWVPELAEPEVAFPAYVKAMRALL